MDWSAMLSLPPNMTFQYKYIKKNPDGSVIWDPTRIARTRPVRSVPPPSTNPGANPGLHSDRLTSPRDDDRHHTANPAPSQARRRPVRLRAVQGPPRGVGAPGQPRLAHGHVAPPGPGEGSRQAGARRAR
ncbi:MAG: hypothetical protein DLM58_04815 [Pseudonocardiales bacterium]|nr:MAG: hypothetical protein DLM58_04815 [Pseudonocardiales bacterium]